MLKDLIRLKIQLTCIALALLVFSIYRVIFLIHFYPSFKNINTLQIFSAFMNGFRFDLNAIFLTLGVSVLMMGLPFSNKIWIKFWLSFYIIILFLLSLILHSDFVFFKFTDRHLGNEIFYLFSELGPVINLIVSQYGYHLLGLTVLLLCIFKGSLFLFKKIQIHDTRRSLPINIFSQILVLIFAIFSIRGGISFHGKPINIEDAYVFSNRSYASLVLNGVFTSIHISRSEKLIHSNFYEETEALEVAKQMCFVESDLSLNDRYPFFRHSKIKKNMNKKNIVILLMESWDPRWVNPYSEKSHITPNFEKLSTQGLLFDNFYANSDNSISAIFTLLTGVPSVIGMPHIGKGTSVTNFNSLPKELSHVGYDSVFIQTSNRRSFRMDKVASAVTFNEYYGKEDIPLLKNYLETSSAGYDYDGLMFLKSKLDEIKNPFLALFFSGTTHGGPYPVLDKKFEIFPRKQELDGYLNSLFYSDFSIGEFFKKAQDSEWYKDTIFIVTSDHVSRVINSKEPREMFHVPFLIYSPTLFEHKTIHTLGSHADLIPTIYDLLEINAEHHSFGKSLFDDHGKRAVTLRKGDLMGLCTHHGFVFHNLKEVVELKKLNTGFDEKQMTKTLLSIYQTIMTFFRQNKFSPT